MQKRNFYSLFVLFFFLVQIALATNENPKDSLFLKKTTKSTGLKQQFDSLFVNYLVKTNPEYSGNSLVALHTNLVIDFYKRQSRDTVRMAKIAPYVPIGSNGSGQQHNATKMDSLLNEWYAQFDENYYSSDSSDFAAFTADSVFEPIHQLPDSVYIERLKKISSVVELTFTEETRKWIEFYTRPRAKYYLQKLIGMAEYYCPIFEEILDQYNVPLEIKYLPLIESGYNSRIVSPAGATGYWQFMPGTGKIMGLELNGLVDERCDPIRATHAAAQYLKMLHEYFNDWTLAIASYNCGPGNITRAMKRSNGGTTYWQIQPKLPRETQKYIPKFTAAVYLMHYYKDYGFEPEKMDLPTLTDTVHFYNNISLAQISEATQIPLGLLEELNPHFRRDIMPGSFGKYTLRVPMKNATQVINMRDSIMSIGGKNIPNLDNNSVKMAMLSKSKRSRVKAKISNANGFMCYTIQSGDNFWNIAQRFQGVTYSDIIEINGMTANSKLIPGNTIKIKKI